MIQNLNIILMSKKTPVFLDGVYLDYDVFI